MDANMQLYNSKILHVAKNVFSNLGCVFLKTNMSNFRQLISEYILKRLKCSHLHEMAELAGADM